jgi:hypothetical protein
MAPEPQGQDLLKAPLTAWRNISMVRTGREVIVALAMAPTTHDLLPRQYSVAWQDGSSSMACRRDPSGVSRAENSPAYGRRTMQTLQVLHRLSIIALMVCTLGIPYAHAADNYRVLKRNTTTLDDGVATYTLSFVL